MSVVHLVLAVTALLTYGCAPAAQETTKPTGRLIENEAFSVRLPDGWEPLALDSLSRVYVNKVSIGKKPEFARQIIRQAMQQKAVKLLAFLKEFEGPFVPNVNIVVLNHETGTLRDHHDGAVEALRSIGMVKGSVLDESEGRIVMESEVKSSEVEDMVQLFQVIRVKGHRSVTLTVSFLEPQRKAVQPAIDLAKATLKIK